MIRKNSFGRTDNLTKHSFFSFPFVFILFHSFIPIQLFLVVLKSDRTILELYQVPSKYSQNWVHAFLPTDGGQNGPARIFFLKI